MSGRRRPSPNLEALEKFWRRSTFHDMSIEDVSAINKRVIIRLSGYTLVMTGVVALERCEELPTVWLYYTIAEKGSAYVLDVETEAGRLRVTGSDFRLIRNADLAMLIPPIDV